MTVQLNCPKCKAPLRLPAELISGTVIQCPQCQGQFACDTGSAQPGASPRRKPQPPARPAPQVVVVYAPPPQEETSGFFGPLFKAFWMITLCVLVPAGGVLWGLHASGKINLTDNALAARLQKLLDQPAAPPAEPQELAQVEQSEPKEVQAQLQAQPVPRPEPSQPNEEQAQSQAQPGPQAEKPAGKGPKPLKAGGSDEPAGVLENLPPGEKPAPFFPQEVAQAKPLAEAPEESSTRSAETPRPMPETPPAAPQGRDEWFSVQGKLLATGTFQELQQGDVIIRSGDQQQKIPFSELSAGDQDRVSALVQNRSTDDGDTLRPARAVKKWALLVGVNGYEHFRDLAFCERDIEQLRTRLLNLGFPAEQIITLTGSATQPELHPTRANIELWLQRLLNGTVGDSTEKGFGVRPRLVGPEDLIVVAFSGHGLQLGEESYFCPREAQLESPDKTLLPMTLVYNKLAAVSRGLRLLLVDACRNDPLSGENPAVEAQTGAFSLQRINGICALSSCSNGQVSVEDNALQHGIFSYYLQAALGGAGLTPNERGEIEVKLNNVINFTVDHTATYSEARRNQKQTPHYIASIEGNPVLGVLKTADQVTRYEPAKPAGPLADRYELKLHQVEVPKLPPGWTSNHGGTVSAYTDGGKPILKTNGDTEAELTSPPLNIHGEFYLEIETSTVYETLGVTLVGAENQKDLTLNFLTHGAHFYYKLGTLEQRSFTLSGAPENPGAILVRLERRKTPDGAGYEYQLLVNGDSTNSRLLVYRFDEYQDFRQIRLKLASTKQEVYDLRVGPMERKPADAKEVTSAYSFRLSRNNVKPPGWELRGKTAESGALFRAVAPELKIRGDFYLRLAGQCQGETKFSLRLLGRNEDRPLPLHFSTYSRWLNVYLPLTGVANYDVVQDKPFLFEMQRKNGAVQISINQQNVKQSFDSGNFGDFDGLLLDVWEGNMIVGELELRPLQPPPAE